MRVFVSIDMEGVAGITDRRQVRRGTDDYPHARALMAGEANAVADAAFEAGAEVVVINDSHGDLNNLQPGDLDGRAQLQIGGGKEPHGMVFDLAAGYDVALLVGYHARAGTTGGVLEHSYSSATIYDLRVNGAPWGEIELNTAILGSAGIPVVLVSGDHLACGQAQDLLPEVHTAVVKQGLGYAATRSLSPEESRRLLAEVTRASLTGPRPAPLTPEGPFRLEIDFLTTAMTDAASVVPRTERTGARTVAVTAETVLELDRYRGVMTHMAATTI